MSVNELRYQYRSSDGRPIWLPFVEGFLCIFCDQPITLLSFGGPAVCGACDSGYNRDSTRWSYDDSRRLHKNAQKRLDEMPTDPTWQEYEDSYLATVAASKETAK